MILSIRNLRVERPLEQGAAYSLVVPALDIRAGEKVLITGPSGSGKSTILDLIGMVLRPAEADLFRFFPQAGQTEALTESSPASHGYDIAGAWSLERSGRRAGHGPDPALLRRMVGYVLQTGGLLPFLSVRDNILTPRRLRGLSDDNFVAGLVHELGIAHLMNNTPAQLSVGERQRAAIARALAAKPPLVLADEPTAALDPTNADSVLSLFTRMTTELGTTLILVSHAPDQVNGMGFRRLHMMQHSRPGLNREAVLTEFPTGGQACPR